jgi:hypothetical protein
MSKGSICAEIGVYKGEYSETVLSLVKPVKLHLIDPWQYQDDERYATSLYGGGIGKDQKNMDSIYAAVQARFADPIESGVVTTHRLPSGLAVALFKDNYFDWVYIDGDHQYEFVKNDLENFYKKLKEGGFLICDDYDLQGWWGDGVIKAVHEFLVSHQCKVAYVDGNQFVIQKSA